MKFHYSITGIHCSSCVEKIKSALLPYYKKINVTADPPRLEIEADNKPILNDLNCYLATAGKYTANELNHQEESAVEQKSSYFPIYLIAIYITGVATLTNFHNGQLDWHGWMNHFMAGFFLVFSAFKFLDLHGFAEGYSTYDLLAKRWFYYGYIYPFLELSLGILFLTQWFPITTLIATIIIMGFSSLGVINSLLKKEKFQCACLGTLLNVPLSSITLIEDLTMVGMAGISLFMFMQSF